MQKYKILVCSAATVLVLPLAESQTADHPLVKDRVQDDRSERILQVFIEKSEPRLSGIPMIKDS